MKKVILFKFLLVLSASSYCQSIINTGGRVLSNESASLSYSVGEITTNNYALIKEGVLQPKLEVITSVSSDFEHQIKLYPNPFTNQLTIDNQSVDSYDLKIISLKGQEIIRKTDLIGITHTNFENHPPGVYTVKLIFGKRQTTFKVIKR